MKRRGFTLIELLVVMAIIATLLTIATPRYFGHLEHAREAALRETLSVVRDAMDKYHSDTGHYPVEAAAATVRHAARFTPRYDGSIRAELPEVERTLADGKRTLIDARPPGQWEGTAKSPAVKAFGRLPHAVWIDQSDALTADGTALKPRAELVKLFGKAGAAPITTYCNTGHLAATDWFVLSEVLHHPDVRLYDASLSQWANDPSRPIVR